MLNSSAGMNLDASSDRTRAFTLVEMLVVIAIIGILAALLLPVLDKGKQRAKRIWCISDLSQVGLAFHTFANDHNGKFPMALSTNEGGSMEYVQNGYDAGRFFYTTFRNFQPLSGELVRPELLFCPTEITRAAATNFPSLQNTNLSYFIGVTATFDKPGSFLAGDRNVYPCPPQQYATILKMDPTEQLHWDGDLHQGYGNVLFSDGHVSESIGGLGGFLNDMVNDSTANQTLFLPSVAIANYDAGSWSGGNSSGSSSSGSMGGSSQNSSSGQVWQSGGSSSGNASQASQSGASAAGQSYQPQGMSSSANKPLYNTRTDTELSVTSELANATPVASVQVSDPTVLPGSDPNSAMSPFDQHLMKTLQHTFEWLYLLLLLLLLLYLAYKIRQRMRQREARLRANQQRSEY